MNEKKPSTTFPVMFQNLEEYQTEDDRFLKVKIWLMHTLINFNGSSFDKEVVEKAIPSLSNTPLLSFIEENSEGEQDFSDHRIVLHREEDGELTTRYLGEYIGVIPETNNAKWEYRLTDSGEEKEYLTVEALMWTKRDSPVDIMKRKGITNQSMELSQDYTGYYDESGVFHFESFKFNGACLLGNDVLPAMENSTVELQFSSNEIKKDIENKLQEFYSMFSTNEKGGNNQMTKENKKQTQEEDVKVVSDYEKEEVDISKVTEKAEETKESDATKTETTTENLTKETEKVEDVDKQADTQSEDTGSYTSDSKASNDESSKEYKEDAKEDSGKSDENTKDSTEVDYEAKYTEAQELANTYASTVKQLESELADLQTYKRQRLEDDLKVKFANKLSDEEFTQVFAEMKEEDLEKVEEKLFALMGKKNFSMKSETKTNVNKVKIVSPKEEVVPFGGFFG